MRASMRSVEARPGHKYRTNSQRRAVFTRHTQKHLAAMADTEPQMEVEQQEEAVVEEVSNAEDAATEVTEEVEAAPEETKEADEDAVEEDAEAEEAQS